MADSDEEYERRKRDKFRRERNDYDHRRDGRDDRRREPWEHDRIHRGSSGRSRDSSWGSRGGRDTGRRDPYGRDYDRTRRERGYSPRRDVSPPVAKRMRRDWDDGGGYPMYDMPHYGGGGGERGGGGGGGGGGGPIHSRGPPPSWGPAPSMGPPQEGNFPGAPGQNVPDPEFPTQPSILTFKQYLTQQEDNISDQDAITKYNEYKLEFKRQQINEFFLAHKDEEWFKSKYHPEEFEKRQEEIRSTLKRRCEVFLELLAQGRLECVSVDAEQHDSLVKVLDAAVIKMEGGTDFDLSILDEPDGTDADTSRSRNNSECQPHDKLQSPDEKKKAKEEGVKEKPLEITIDDQQKELMKKAQEFSKKQREPNGKESDDRKRGKKRHRDKSEYSYESGSESDSESGSDSEPEPAPPGMEDEPPPPGLEEGEMLSPSKRDKDAKEGKDREEKDEDTKNEEDAEEKEIKPRALHRTSSIFLRNLAPSITKQEVEAVCKRYPGFIRVALQDPQPERRFFRRGWVTFDKSVNIKDICWNLNNIRLRDCDLGATLNRELKQRVRPVNSITVHHKVIRQDIKLAAKIIQNFDDKWKIWDDGSTEKVDKEKELTLSLQAKNPVLKNITDYLVEEGSYEEEELLGTSVEEGEKDTDPEIQLDRDETLSKVLDKLVLYLRIVHSIDYYSANEYPNEDEMPHRCGIMHARGIPSTKSLTKKDLEEWIKNYEVKVKPFVELQDKVQEEDAKKLGRKDPDDEVEKFVTANTGELAKDKWLCPLSGKKFKGPDFVRKHIFNKHSEKVEEVKKEVSFFNNFLLDPKRPQLPDHPGNQPSSGSGSSTSQPGQYPGPGAGTGFQGPSQGMMGYSQQRPPMMGGYGGGGGGGGGGMPPYQSQSFNRRDNFREDPGVRSRSSYNRQPFRRSDPRGIIEYRDLDAPDDVDIF